MYPASHSCQMDSSEQLCKPGTKGTCHAAERSIGKVNSDSCVEVTCCPLGDWMVIGFVVGRLLIARKSNVAKLPVLPESAIKKGGQISVVE